MHGKYLAGLLVNYAQPNNTTPQVVPTTLLLVDWVSGSHVALALKLPQVGSTSGSLYSASYLF